MAQIQLASDQGLIEAVKRWLDGCRAAAVNPGHATDDVKRQALYLFRDHRQADAAVRSFKRAARHRPGSGQVLHTPADELLIIALGQPDAPYGKVTLEGEATTSVTQSPFLSLARKVRAHPATDVIQTIPQANMIALLAAMTHEAADHWNALPLDDARIAFDLGQASAAADLGSELASEIAGYADEIGITLRQASVVRELGGKITIGRFGRYAHRLIDTPPTPTPVDDGAEEADAIPNAQDRDDDPIVIPEIDGKEEEARFFLYMKNSSGLDIGHFYVGLVAPSGVEQNFGKYPSTVFETVIHELVQTEAADGESFLQAALTVGFPGEKAASPHGSLLRAIRNALQVVPEALRGVYSRQTIADDSVLREAEGTSAIVIIDRPISAEQYLDALTYIKRERDHPAYYILLWDNCVDFTRNVMNRVGLSGGPGDYFDREKVDFSGAAIYAKISAVGRRAFSSSDAPASKD